jgi:ribonuclease P protein component
MQKLSYSFPKKYRLSGGKNIETLLSKGEAFFVFPYRIVYRILPKTETPISILIAVPKRKCKLATQRNRIKRITKEAFRKQQHLIVNQALAANLHIRMMLQYTQQIETPIQQTDIAIQKILKSLCHQIQSKCAN